MEDDLNLSKMEDKKNKNIYFLDFSEDKGQAFPWVGSAL